MHSFLPQSLRGCASGGALQPTHTRSLAVDCAVLRREGCAVQAHVRLCGSPLPSQVPGCTPNSPDTAKSKPKAATGAVDLEQAWGCVCFEFGLNPPVVLPVQAPLLLSGS
eukprot:303852-Rhodomonas_salina.9